MISDRRQTVVLIGFLMATSSCGDAGPTAPGSGVRTEPQPTRIQISAPTDTTLLKHLEGDTITLQVSAFDASGSRVALLTPVIWTGSDSALSVSATGIATILESGAGRAIATSGALADTMQFNLDVTPNTVLHISPRSDTVQHHLLDDTLQLGATVTDLFLHKDLTSTTRIQWASLDSTAVVTSTGGVVLHKTGTVNVVASAGALADTVSFHVDVSLPRLRIVSINGVSINPAGATAVADSFNAVIEVRNPSTGSVIENVFFATGKPFVRTVTPRTGSSIQPGETALVQILDPFAPAGSYTAYAMAQAGSVQLSGPEILVDVTNSDASPPELQSLNPSSDTTWTAGTPLTISFNLVDLQSGVDGFAVHSAWASPQPAGCMDTPTGGVDQHVTFLGIPVTLNFTGCVVPRGTNTIVITTFDRAGNTTTKTLTITGI